MTYFILGAVIGFIIAGAFLSFSPKDDTDAAWNKRSNMRLGIDYRTGLHYLMSPQGGITPRLNVDSSQIKEME